MHERTPEAARRRPHTVELGNKRRSRLPDLLHKINGSGLCGERLDRGARKAEGESPQASSCVVRSVPASVQMMARMLPSLDDGRIAAS